MLVKYDESLVFVLVVVRVDVYFLDTCLFGFKASLIFMLISFVVLAIKFFGFLLILFNLFDDIFKSPTFGS